MHEFSSILLKITPRQTVNVMTNLKIYLENRKLLEILGILMLHITVRVFREVIFMGNILRKYL